MNEYTRGSKDTRPWGQWEVIDTGEKHCVKRITVLPGHLLSLQYHHHRDEHWIVVAGKADVTIGETTTRLGVNRSAFIPRSVKHRLGNSGEALLTVIEIQYGDELLESDIVRIEDAYNRP